MTRTSLFVGTCALSLSLAMGCSPAVAEGNGDDAIAQSEDALLAGTGGVFFNHTYGVISKATTDAMATNAYLKDTFVDVEVRTTVRPDSTYTGTYLNTRETYLEFFPEGTFGYPVGVTGLGLGDEKEGGLQVVHDKWAKVFGADQVDPLSLVSHEIGGVQVPWFNQTGPVWGDNSDFTGVWDMEYLPNAGSTAPRTRHEERAARYDASKLAQNVQAVVYGLPDTDRANMRTTLTAVGWRTATLGDGFIALSPRDHGTRRVYIAKKSSPGHIGLLGVVWRLNRFASHVEKVGDATLKVGLFGLPYASMWFAAPVASEDDDAAASATAAASAD